MGKKSSNYNGNHSYENKNILVGKSKEGHPVIEKTMNAELFPLCPHSKIDCSDMKQKSDD